MSYNYYCYGQIKNEKGEWVEYSKDPFYDGLKHLIDFDEVPECFELIKFEQDSDFDKECVSKYFMEKYSPKDYCYSNGYFVRLDRFIQYYVNKIKIANARLSVIMKCLGIEVNDDMDFNDIETIYEVICNNEEKKNSKTTIPISKTGIYELMKCIAEISKCEQLLGMANVFQSLTYDSFGLDSEKRSFLFIME